MGTGVLSHGIKLPWREADNSPSIADVKNDETITPPPPIFLLGVIFN
jgi:hypothetical protein